MNSDNHIDMLQCISQKVDLIRIGMTSYGHQPKRRTTSYRLRSFSYLGSKLWNDIVNSDPGTANCDFNDAMDFLKHWEDLSMNKGFPYVWHFTTLNARLFYRIFTLSYFELYLKSSISFMYTSLLHCICHAPSHILAFWLMLSGLCTTK